MTTRTTHTPLYNNYSPNERYILNLYTIHNMHYTTYSHLYIVVLCVMLCLICYVYYVLCEVSAGLPCGETCSGRDRGERKIMSSKGHLRVHFLYLKCYLDYTGLGHIFWWIS